MRNLLTALWMSGTALLATGCMDPVQANAGADRTVDGGTTVTLDGSSSFPRDASRISYQWEVVSEDTVTLADAAAAVTEFTAPRAGTESNLRIKLTVTYIGFTGELVTENSDTDEVIIRVRAGAEEDEDADTQDESESSTETMDETTDEEMTEETTPELQTEATP
jgi:hypothetical protein